MIMIYFESFEAHVYQMHYNTTHFNFEVWGVWRRNCSPKQIDAHIYQVRNNIAHTSCALHYCSCEYCDNCQDGFISQNILRLTCIKSTIILYISSERSVELVWGIFCFPKINWNSHIPSALGITIWHIPSVMSVVNSFTYY